MELERSHRSQVDPGTDDDGVDRIEHPWATTAIGVTVGMAVVSIQLFVRSRGEAIFQGDLTRHWLIATTGSFAGLVVLYAWLGHWVSKRLAGRVCAALVLTPLIAGAIGIWFVDWSPD